MDNFTIVLFKNKTKKKIIKKFKTKQNAKKYYDKLINENKQVIFGVETENGKSCVFELGLVSKNENFNSYFIRDEFGRSIKIELDDSNFSIVELHPYKKEELIYDIKNSKRINFTKFIKTYLPKVGVKLLSKLNNKIIVQKDSDVDLFSLKSEDDSDRFIDEISSYMIKENRIDTIIVKDSSSVQKKYLYDLLNENGFPKSILYRRFTTYKR